MRKNGLKKRRLGLLPSENHTRPQDNRVLKPEFLNRILHTNLHFRIRHIGRKEPSSPRTRHENKRPHARFLSRSRDRNAQVVVDLPLILDAAGGHFAGADCVEDDGWRGGEGGDESGPFGDVGFFEGLEFGGLGGWEAAGDGADGGEGVGGEEGGEDLRADGAGAAEE